MTREEAIMELKQFSGTTRLRLSANFWEALNRAIKALEEPCEDAVSRKAVLNTLDFTDKFLDETRTVESYKTLLEECYKNLPSVTPIHKDRTVQDFVDKCRECGKQRWIPCSERLPNESGKYWCTFSGTNLMGIDFYTTESYAKKWFDEPEEYIGWESKNVSAWMPLPEPYKAGSEG